MENELAKEVYFFPPKTWIEEIYFPPCLRQNSRSSCLFFLSWPRKLDEASNDERTRPSERLPKVPLLIDYDWLRIDCDRCSQGIMILAITLVTRLLVTEVKHQQHDWSTYSNSQNSVKMQMLRQFWLPKPENFRNIRNVLKGPKFQPKCSPV